MNLLYCQLVIIVILLYCELVILIYFYIGMFTGCYFRFQSLLVHFLYRTFVSVISKILISFTFLELSFFISFVYRLVPAWLPLSGATACLATSSRRARTTPTTTEWSPSDGVIHPHPHNWQAQVRRPLPGPGRAGAPTRPTRCKQA
jgi:hypothetical protein